VPVASLPGLDLAYDSVGEGPPLLLIAGLSPDRGPWRFQLDAYSREFTCFALDNRGAGESGKPPGPYTTAQMADDAVALLDHLGIERAHAAGCLFFEQPARFADVTLDFLRAASPAEVAT
jgi:pimeloyl-ACP methyl ester carboxylesterase